jgi:hypothetical protein
MVASNGKRTQGEGKQVEGEEVAHVNREAVRDRYKKRGRNKLRPTLYEILP